MARLYHVLVSMIYGHDTGVASPGRDGANNLYLYFYIMISLCIYFVCRFNFLVPCVSIQLADSTDPFSMKEDSATRTLLCRRRRGMASGAPTRRRPKCLSTRMARSSSMRTSTAMSSRRRSLPAARRVRRVRRAWKFPRRRCSAPTACTPRWRADCTARAIRSPKTRSLITTAQPTTCCIG